MKGERESRRMGWKGREKSKRREKRENKTISQ